MSFFFEYFTTNDNDPTISNRAIVTNAVNQFTILLDTGDEFLLRSGDLSLQLLSPLPYDGTSGVNNWLGVYWNDFQNLVEIFFIGSSSTYNNSFQSFDEKRGLYFTRLSSLGARFYRDVDSLRVAYDTDPANYAFDLVTNTEVEVESVKQEGQAGPVLDRIGLSLGDILLNIVGKTQGFGFEIDGITHTVPVKPFSKIPILINGIGWGFGTPDSEVMKQYFEDNEITWKNIFEMAAYTENAFLALLPNIDGNRLGVDVEMITRVRNVGSGSTAINWVERVQNPNAFRVDGVVINTPVSSVDAPPYRFGNTESGNVITNSVAASNPEPSGVPQFVNLYMFLGTLISGPDPLIYSVIDGNNENIGYLTNSVIDFVYQPQLRSGLVYSGRIQYNGERILTRTDIGPDNFRLIRIEANRDGLANVDALKFTL